MGIEPSSYGVCVCMEWVHWLLGLASCIARSEVSVLPSSSLEMGWALWKLLQIHILQV
jgi:hypothetical protein